MSQGWRHEAACRQADESAAEAFFALDGETELIAAAKRVCAHCPVQAKCLAWALDAGQDYGVWGGLSAAERRELRAQHLMQRRAGR